MEAKEAAISTPKPKFSVYQNPTFSAALTAKSLEPSASTLFVLLSFSSAFTFTLLIIALRRSDIIGCLEIIGLSSFAAYSVARSLEIFVGILFISTLTSLVRAVLWRNVRVAAVGSARLAKHPSLKNVQEKPAPLTQRQLGLLGLKSKVEEISGASETPKKPPKSKPLASELLIPIRRSAHSYSSPKKTRIGYEQQSTSAGKNSGMSPISPAKSYMTSPATPWSKKSSSSGKGILTEEMLEQFLADVDEKITESASSTPPATIHGFGITSPSSATSSLTTSGVTRSTPLRSVRMSPGSHQKYGTPPKKGEGELPSPMSMEQMIEAYDNLGIFPQIEQWRDRLRQWCSSILLNPLVEKIKISHLQVMQTAAAVGISVTVNQVGTDVLTTPPPLNVSPIDGTKEWRPTFTLDEDGVLHQLRATLVQARDGSVSQIPSAGGQQNPVIPLIQVCIDAITEHQRLNSLMKGELVKGLLPQSSVRAEYTVQRVQELADGTCVKNFEYMSTGEVYDKLNKKWSLELPSDSHLLAHLFCAFLDHPKWMLHVDPTSYSSTQSSKNPLFLGFLPPKERFPEKYVAVISFVPSIIHPGACILVIGKQGPPIFTLYWEKKLQFSLQGRTALWDAILLLCHRINIGFGGVVRGLHLGSSAFNILPIFDIETDD